ncbi:MAG: hypothetical protein ABID71_10215 [Chloroflexota bacterium]
MAVIGAVEGYSHPGGPDAGGLGVVVDLLGEVGADVGVIDVFFRIGRVFLDKSDQLREGGVGGVRVIDQGDGLAVPAALDIAVFVNEIPG